MIGASSFMDEIDCAGLFDLLDFPGDENAEVGLTAGNGDANNTILPTQSPLFPGSDSDLSGNRTSDFSAELYVPELQYEDIAQLEWLSNFVEDSFSGGDLTINKKEEPSSLTNNDSSHHQFQTSSPVSVLESSTSSSGDKNIPISQQTITSVNRVRARSKRSRPTTFHPRPDIQLIPPKPPTIASFLPPKIPSDSENFAESRPLIKIRKQVASDQKKKKIKMSVPLAPLETNRNLPQPHTVRKCMHCEVTKTPQWRAGPMGPKTLCNACGVRYKSGRLFPEYRPAASPTFVPTLHSNSHKKVLEMRSNGSDDSGTVGSATAELIPNTNSMISPEYV